MKYLFLLLFPFLAFSNENHLLAKGNCISNLDVKVVTFSTLIYNNIPKSDIRNFFYYGNNHSIVNDGLNGKKSTFVSLQNPNNIEKEQLRTFVEMDKENKQKGSGEK